METTISKAEQKRRKQAFEYLDNALRRSLRRFENEYLDHAARWAVRKIELEIDKIEKMKSEVDKTKLRWESVIANHDHRIKVLRTTLHLDMILKLQALKDAKENYDEKVNKIVHLLVAEGFNYQHFKIEQIEDCTSKDLEFLISNDKKEVHARLIFAHGPIKAPHFRFITTVRQK